MSTEKVVRGRPMGPGEMNSSRISAIPYAVFDVFNELIAKNFSSGAATIMQDEVAAAIAERMKVPISTVFEENWLDVEKAYRNVGWRVLYDKPAYCENYDAFFVFRRR